MATNILVSNINGSTTDKYLFICNNFDKDEDNALISPNISLKFTISDYVEHFKHYENMKPEDFSNERSVQKVAFLVL